MADMGYAAANISEREVAAGYDIFLGMKKDSRVPLISANFVLQQSGKPIGEPYIIVTFEPKKYPALKKPLRIGLTGVTRFNPTFLKAAPPKDNVIIASPADSLKAIIPELRKKVDQVVVLASMTKDDAHVLAKSVEGIDMIIGGYGGFITAVEEKEGKTVIFYCGTQGKWLGEIKVFQSDAVVQVKSSLHYLNVQYPEDPTMKAKVDEALVAINNAGRLAVGTAPTPVPGSAAAAVAPTAPGAAASSKRFVTSAACKDCHESEYAVWAGSKHAHAMQTLVEAKADFNTACLPCHVVGWKKVDGFVDATTTPELGNVQCESCHGPALKHILDPSTPYGRTGRSVCVTCHNKENSPNFDFDTYWPRVKHGP